MKCIDFEEWRKSEARMRDKARLILAYFDLSRLSRKPKTGVKGRPSKLTALPGPKRAG